MARWRRVAIVVVVAALAGYLAYLLWGWGVGPWAIAAGVVALVVAVIVTRRSGDSRTAPRDSAELYASDPFSDIELGRSAPTHPHHDPAESSQIEDPPPHDSPYRLPPERGL